MMQEMFDLSGKIALVTGANRGLGQGIALGLASAGADLVCVSRREAEETLTGIQELGRRGVWIQADLQERNSPIAIRDQALAAFPQVDILVNNAGIIRRAPFLEYDPEDWESVLTVNLTAPFRLSQLLGKEMVSRGQGKIIHVASLLSFQGGINVAAYTAAKSGLAGLTRLMSNELAPTGVNVNAIAPGYMATENTRALREDGVRNRAILERIPAGRWGAPTDLAGAAVFLASAASDYVHGHLLTVDGGWMAR